MAGDYQPEIVHALAFQTQSGAGQHRRDGPLCRKRPARAVRGVGPAGFHCRPEAGTAQRFSSPERIRFTIFRPDWSSPEALARVPHSIHLGLYDDETGSRCAWHVPESHYLEAWGDILAIDGTPSLIQPMIEPLYPDTLRCWKSSRSSSICRAQAGYDIVHDFWQSRLSGVAERVGALAEQGRGRRRARRPTRRRPSPVPSASADGVTPPPVGSSAPRRPAAGSNDLDFSSRTRRWTTAATRTMLASGIAAAADQADVGQRRHGQPETAKERGLHIGDVVGSTANRRDGGRAGVDSAGACGRVRERDARLRPHATWARWPMAWASMRTSSARSDPDAVVRWSRSRR